MIIKVCLSIFCYDRNIDRATATYRDHINIMSYHGLKSMYHAGSFKHCFIFCINVIIKFI